MKIDLNNVIEYSDNYTKSRNNIRAYMKDIYPCEEIRILNILLNVYESGISKELSTMKDLSVAKYNSYVKRLEYDYGMDTESAIEALNVWVDNCIGIGVANGYASIKVNQRNVEQSAYSTELYDIAKTIKKDSDKVDPSKDTLEELEEKKKVQMRRDAAEKIGSLSWEYNDALNEYNRHKFTVVGPGAQIKKKMLLRMEQIRQEQKELERIRNS